VAEPMPMMDQWPEQQLAYARDLRRIYNQERARQRELEATNRALAAANAELAASNAALAHANRELDRRICDLIAVQDWVLAVNSSRDLPALMDLMAQPLVLLLRACTTVVYPWEPAANALGRALGYGILVETPALAALRTSALSAAVLAAARRWEVADLAASDESGGGPSYAPARALGWRAFVALPLVARDERMGLLYVAWDTRHHTDERERMLLDLLAQHAAVGLANARLLAAVRERAEALADAEQQLIAYGRDLRRAYESERVRRAEVLASYVATVKVLAAAVETRDPYTGGHVERVAALSVAIGRELDWDADRLAKLELGAALHDVGKIGVPDAVLRKPGPLDPEEWDLMRQHPEIGARMLRDVPFLAGSLGCVLSHQERYDGRGYPTGLRGEEIPVEARAVAVADTYDAMTSDRPYRKALPVEVALAEIERCSGSQFDPQMVAAFLRAVKAGAIVAMENRGAATAAVLPAGDAVGWRRALAIAANGGTRPPPSYPPYLRVLPDR